MEDYIKTLKDFRDLKITKEQLKGILKNNPDNLVCNQPIEVYTTNIISLLENYINGSIKEDRILEWVNTIWFSDWFIYNEEQCDSIASVMNELEEIDEEGKELTIEKVERYINVLVKNIEL